MEITMNIVVIIAKIMFKVLLTDKNLRGCKLQMTIEKLKQLKCKKFDS